MDENKLSMKFLNFLYIIFGFLIITLPLINYYFDPLSDSFDMAFFFIRWIIFSILPGIVFLLFGMNKLNKSIFSNLSLILGSIYTIIFELILRWISSLLGEGGLGVGIILSLFLIPLRFGYFGLLIIAIIVALKKRK